ncbi:MAG: hypothetical protein RL701_110, partial [Pseudomonadota bacterium]
MQVPTGKSRPARRHQRRSPSLGVTRRLTLSLWPLAALAAASCTGEIRSEYDVQYTNLPSSPDAGAPATPANGAGAGARSTAGAGTAGVGPNASPNTNCTGTPQAVPAPLARLTNLEHRNTLQALFPALDLPEIALPADIVVEGFDNNAKAQTPSPALVEQYQAAARAVADVVKTQLDAVLPCPAGTTAQQDSCGP